MIDEKKYDDFIEELDIDIDPNTEYEELEDSRISEKVNKCVKAKLIYNNTKMTQEPKKDIEIDFISLLNMKDIPDNDILHHISLCNIKRRKVNGSKFFIFLKNFKIILSYMTHEELQYLLIMRLLCENWDKYSASKIKDRLETVLLKFAEFANRFIKEIDPIAYTPKCAKSEDKFLEELYFSEAQLKYLVKVIIVSKITLLFTDNVHKDYRGAAKKEIANRIWSLNFTNEDKEINIKNKIHKLIASRFVSTEHNEKRFWNAAEFANITITTQENIIHNELRTDSILMLEFERNPLSFLDVFLKNTIFYLSKRKFPLEYILNSFDAEKIQMQNDITTEFKFTLLEDTLMKRTVDTFIKQNIDILVANNEELFNDFKYKFQKNILHFWIVIPYISRLLHLSPMFLVSLHKDKFIMLVFYMYHQLISLKCFSIASLLKSNLKENVTGSYNEHVKNASQQIDKFLKTEKLQEYIKTRSFNNNINEVLKLIIHPIITMTMNTYYNLNDSSLVSPSVNMIIEDYLSYLDALTQL